MSFLRASLCAFVAGALLGAGPGFAQPEGAQEDDRIVVTGDR